MTTTSCIPCAPLSAQATYGVSRDFELAGDRAVVVANRHEGTVDQILVHGLEKTEPAIRGTVDAVATAVSTTLEHGVPLEVVLRDATAEPYGVEEVDAFLGEIFAWLADIA